MFDFLKRKNAPGEAKASAAGPVIAWGGSGRVAWSPRDVPSLTRSGFQGNPVGFRSVKLISEAAAALPVVLQDAERRFVEHPRLALFAAPNAVQGRAEMFEAIYAQLLLTGNAYVEAVGDSGLPLELPVLRSARMSAAREAPAAIRYPLPPRHRHSRSTEAARRSPRTSPPGPARRWARRTAPTVGARRTAARRPATPPAAQRPPLR